MSVNERDRAAALANRSRRRVFSTIADAGRPLGIAELADSCGIHPTTFRLRLGRLRSVGLVVRASDGPERRPGRPPYRYLPAENDPADGVQAIALGMAVQGF